jgi:hypothetical protein
MTESMILSRGTAYLRVAQIAIWSGSRPAVAAEDFPFAEALPRISARPNPMGTTCGFRFVRLVEADSAATRPTNGL